MLIAGKAKRSTCSHAPVLIMLTVFGAGLLAISLAIRRPAPSL